MENRIESHAFTVVEYVIGSRFRIKKQMHVLKIHFLGHRVTRSKYYFQWSQ